MGGSRNSEFVVSSDSPGVVALGAHPSDGDTDLSVSAPLSARQKSQLGEPQYHAASSPPVPDASVLLTALFEECWSISLADDRGAIGSDASRSIDPVDAGDRMASVVVRFVNDRSATRSDTSRSINPVGANGSLGLLGESERTKCQDDRECKVFHVQWLQVVHLKVQKAA